MKLILERKLSKTNIKAKVAIPQNWNNFTQSEHEIWRKLYIRQIEILKNRACDEFLIGLEKLDILADGIPNFDKLNAILKPFCGWEVIPVLGLIDDADFFECLANRIFPAGNFIRKENEFDYISQPDIFHDVFGHVPLLTNQIFADYMQEYGKGGCRALGLHSLKELSRLYWYSVEFGLIRNDKGLKVYGAGILSSPLETIYALESPIPNRIKFNLERIMTTNYEINDVQKTYFVIEDFKELFDATKQDFAPIYNKIMGHNIIEPWQIIENDNLIQI